MYGWVNTDARTNRVEKERILDESYTLEEDERKSIT
jgi:hypothetical protein